MKLREARKLAKQTRGIVWFKKHKGTWGVLDRSYKGSPMYSDKGMKRKCF